MVIEREDSAVVAGKYLVNTVSEEDSPVEMGGVNLFQGLNSVVHHC